MNNDNDKARCDFSRPARLGCAAHGFKVRDDCEACNSAGVEPQPASAADDDSRVFYPGIVDQKTLSACLGTAELIIRDPKPDRIERFQCTKAKLIAQVKRYPMSFDEWNREHNSELTKEQTP